VCGIKTLCREREGRVSIKKDAHKCGKTRSTQSLGFCQNCVCVCVLFQKTRPYYPSRVWSFLTYVYVYHHLIKRSKKKQKRSRKKRSIFVRERECGGEKRSKQKIARSAFLVAGVVFRISWVMGLLQFVLKSWLLNFYLVWGFISLSYFEIHFFRLRVCVFILNNINIYILLLHFLWYVS